MSRIGKKPVEIPAGVTATVAGQTVEVKGPKGTRSFTATDDITVTLDGNMVAVQPRGTSKRARQQWGMARSMVANLVEGVTKGFRKDLDIVGVGYRAEVKGKQVVFALGYSHPVVFEIPAGIDIAIDKQTHITVTGVDRQAVGQVAANIRRLRKPDPYKQKGVRYTGEVLKKKAGKTGAK